MEAGIFLTLKAWTSARCMASWEYRLPLFLAFHCVLFLLLSLRSRALQSITFFSRKSIWPSNFHIDLRTTSQSPPSRAVSSTLTSCALRPDTTKAVAKSIRSFLEHQNN
jgi:hypothetical protein